MSKHPRTVIWEARPHTIAKIELLRSYLKAWLSIIGRSPTFRGQDILYVDGFSGPGEYTNYPSGSPIAAVEAADSVLKTHSMSWLAGDVHLAFFDQDEDRITFLRRKLASCTVHHRIQATAEAANFEESVALLRRRHPLHFSTRKPLFVFIDPFGAKGVPFAVIRELLASPTSEILLNLDADGIARILRAGADAKSESILDDIFGAPEWRHHIDHRAPLALQCRQVLGFYRRQLETQAKYVFAFEMCGKAGTLDYYLVFASEHPLGLTKMKEAMKTIDQTGAYQFGDGNVGQTLLFRFDDPHPYAKELFSRFRGQQVTREKLVDFALLHTPFVNPIKMLAILEKADLIEQVVERKGPKKRRKGTFPEDLVEAIVFAD